MIRTASIAPSRPGALARALPGIVAGRGRGRALAAIAGLALALGTAAPARPQQPVPQPRPEPVLTVGIEQRFGEEANDALDIRALPGDRLTLTFAGGDGRETSVAVERLELAVTARPLAEPTTDERVVLGTYRSFETAEESANQWRSRGIAVEIAQPSNRWQVWADRETYATPLLRRLLYDSLEPVRADGDSGIVLESEVLAALPQPTWVANGYRYRRDRLKIQAGRNVIQVGDRRYGGSLELQPNAYGSFTLVNQVPLETYLRGVVPFEIGPNAPRAAVEAQAILARTYALRNTRRFAIDDYQLCADTHCQVYKGLPEGAYAKPDAAIAATRGQVLVYDGELADALYYAVSGGVTAAFGDVWDGPERPYLQPVVDSAAFRWDLDAAPLSDEGNLRRFLAIEEGFNEAGWRDFRWRYETDLPAIAEFLRRYLRNNNSPLAEFQRLDSLTVTERSRGGRVRALVAETDLGPVRIEKDAVRSAFEAPRSSLFYLEPRYANDASGQQTLRGYAFVGGGWGHGVGLTQSGAQRLARLGRSAREILEFYYPGARVQPLTNDIVFWRPPPLPAETGEFSGDEVSRSRSVSPGESPSGDSMPE